MLHKLAPFTLLLLVTPPAPPAETAPVDPATGAPSGILRLADVPPGRFLKLGDVPRTEVERAPITTRSVVRRIELPDPPR